jgi:hypothetical protein
MIEMGSAVFWTLVFVAVAVLLFALDRIALWMEARGWIYWRRSKHNPSGALGNAFLEVQSILEPEKGRAAEQKLHKEPGKSESGEPPVPGADRDEPKQPSN